MPDKPVKHIAVHQQPVGTSKNNRLKVKDGLTGKVSWRSGKRGFRIDWDGEPTSRNYNYKDFKPSHKVHGGRKAKEGKAPKDNKMPEMPEE